MIICDKCSNEITILPIINRLGSGIEIEYFTCPNCQTIYHITTTDLILRQRRYKLGRRVKNLKQAYSRNEKEDILAKLIKEINDERVELLKRAKVLKGRFTP